MEYCFNGNLRDYITRYRDYFMDEVNPISGELREEAVFYRSPTDSDNFPLPGTFTNSRNICWK